MLGPASRADCCGLRACPVGLEKAQLLEPVVLEGDARGPSSPQRGATHTPPRCAERDFIPAKVMNQPRGLWRSMSTCGPD